MLPQQPPLSGEYWWRQQEPVPAAAMALLALPDHIRIAVSYGAQTRRQALSLALRRSETGLDHLALQPLVHRGDLHAANATSDLFVLLMNTLVTLLQRHNPPELSLGGTVPTGLDCGGDTIALPWQRFGFQLFGEPSQHRRRVLARVRDLRIAASMEQDPWPPHQLPWEQVQWQPLSRSVTGPDT